LIGISVEITELSLLCFHFIARFHVGDFPSHARKHMKEKNEAEQRELKLLLARANNEILKLAHSLSVRGMLEKIE
jgi:hypothetical protein